MSPIQHNDSDWRVDRRDRDDSGQVTAFVVVMVTALLLCAGLVIDGGLTLAAKIRATDEAQTASRAGAEQINLAIYRESGTVVLNPVRAAEAAEEYLGSTGDHGQVSVNGNTITVTVEATQPTQILGIAGLRSLTVSATASASAERGITELGQ
ncbi:MAG: pilus assembly protein TadG-related protein [Acidimicrobiales bacterium]